MIRPAWDEYFLDLSRAVATRATCLRAQVGAVLVRNHQILATGYNGSMPGSAHCTEAGCLLDDGHCIRTTHAEANAVAQAAKCGVALAGATAYVTIKPCWGCFKFLAAAGVSQIYYGEDYGSVYPMENIKCERLS